MSSAERVVRVLEHIVRATSPPTQAEVAAAVGIPRSTVSDIVSDLRDLGYVQLVDRRCVPGPGLLFLGHAVAAEDSLRQRLRPTLEAIAQETGATTMLTVGTTSGEEKLRIFVIDAVSGADQIRYVPALGPRTLYPNAAGRVFLAYTGRSAADLPPGLLVKQTPKTIVDPEEIDRDLARTRSRGYAFSDDEGRMGISAIAAPVFDPAGALIAAVTIVVPSARSKELRTRLWPVLRDRLGNLDGTQPSGNNAGILAM